MNGAKGYLQQLRVIDGQIRRIERDIADIRERIGIRGLSYDREKVQTAQGDSLAEAMGQIDLLERREAHLLAMLKRKRLRITLMIGRLREPHAEILNLRYCYNQPLAVVAKNMGYSFEWTRHLHGDALNRFYERYKTEVDAWLRANEHE